MSLESGQSLGHYRIVDKIGEGGMGEVYLAEDTRLKRQVALKVLPPDLAGDPERRSRFEREAQAVAALNHPNIVTIFSVEEADTIPFLTMERVSGKPLTSIVQRPLPLEQIFKLAIPMADALGAAHEQGITHRDLKPDNVMVDEDGRIKVLDFGLAKLHEPAAADPSDATSLPTATITAEGRILGTASYMSPEQAEGKSIRPSSDIFSLGIILYEMTTGQRPFTGDTPISTISAILREEPKSVLQTNPTLPRHLDRVIRRCLAKDPTRRYASGLDLRNELEMLQEDLASGAAELDGGTASGSEGSPTDSTSGKTKVVGSWWPLAALGLLALVVGLAIGSLFSTSGTAPENLPGTDDLSNLIFTQATHSTGVESSPTLSPDGDFILYTAQEEGVWNIYLLRVGGTRPINLTGEIPEDCGQPAYSPDGQFIAFRSETQGGGLFIMGSTGESLRRVSSFGYNPTWSPGGESIAFTEEGVFEPESRNRKSGLWIANVATGESRKVIEGDAVQPSWSPSGERIAFWTYHPDESRSGQRDIHTVRIDGSDERPVTIDEPMDWNPLWGPNGDYLYFASDRDGSRNLWRVPLDQTSGEVTGSPQRIPIPATTISFFGLAANNGSIVYSSTTQRVNLAAVTLEPDKDWSVGASRLILSGSLQTQYPAPSPDGKWITFQTTGSQEDICLVRPDGTGFRRLTNDRARDRGAIFIPGTERIAFYSNRSGKYEIWTINSDGSGLQQLTDLPDADPYWPAFSPDGRMMSTYGPSGTLIFKMDKVPLRIEDAVAPRPVDRSTLPLLGAWSPDGRYLAGTDLGGEPGLIIYDLDAEPADAFEFLNISPKARDLTWHPGGSHLILSTDAGIHILDVKSGSTRRLPIEGNQGRITTSADGRTIYYTTEHREADIWLASRTP